MKISIALSLLILALAGAYGWKGHQRLEAAGKTRALLLAEAARFGIAADPAHAVDSVRLTKRGTREDKEAEARLAAKDFIAFAKEMEAIEKKGGQPDEATQKRIMGFLDRVMSLDAGQVKILIAEIKNTPDLREDSRQNLIGFSIMSLAGDHPQTALAIFTESSDIFKDNGMGKQVVSTSLAKWAKDDPLGALDWVRQNGTKFPDLVSDEAKRSLVQGAAANDPKTAFKLIGELGLKGGQIGNAISGIMGTAKTSDERTASLAALRGYTSGLTDEELRGKTEEAALQSLAGSVMREDYEAGSRWIESARLTPTELANFSKGMDFDNDAKDRGKWIEWLGENPTYQTSAQIGNIIQSWAETDYQAAGKWLAAAPAGATKNTSVRAYAETLSRYEPEAAAQWADTLPPGKDREETLSSIYGNWPKNDAASKAAAASFAKQHGIKITENNPESEPR